MTNFAANKNTRRGFLHGKKNRHVGEGPRGNTPEYTSVVRGDVECRGRALAKIRENEKDARGDFVDFIGRKENSWRDVRRYKHE